MDFQKNLKAENDIKRPTNEKKNQKTNLNTALPSLTIYLCEINNHDTTYHTCAYHKILY